MIDKLIEILKKNVNIFIDEYSNYLDIDSLNKLRKIDYQNIFVFKDINVPFGTINFDKIYLSNSNHELINNLKNMPNYNSSRYMLNTKNLSSYIRYMCDNGYSDINLYEDIIMHFIFDLVINDDSFLIKGFINQEIKFLSIKYGVHPSGLFEREEKICTLLTRIYSIEMIRNIIFKNKVNAYKYLCDELGFKYANLYNEIEYLVDKEYSKIKDKEYIGLPGFLDYVSDYDNLSYADAYNTILDFEVENKL